MFTTTLLTSFVLLFSSVSCILKDVVFVVDRSFSLQQNDFNEAMDFIYNVTKWLPIGKNDFCISVVTFSNTYKEEFDLDDILNKPQLLKQVSGIRETEVTFGGTKTDVALKFVGQHSFTSSHGGRPGSDRIVIVITDGESDHPILTAQAADHLKNHTKAEVYAVGVGSATLNSNREIIHMASSPPGKYVQHVDSFLYLCSLVPSMVAQLDSSVVAKVSKECPVPETNIQSSSLMANTASDKTKTTAKDKTGVVVGALLASTALVSALAFGVVKYLKRSRISTTTDDQLHAFGPQKIETSAGPVSTNIPK